MEGERTQGVGGVPGGAEGGERSEPTGAEPGTRRKRARRTFTDEQKRAYVAAQAKSGLTVSAFCLEQKLHPSRFRAWREELGAGSESAEPKSPARSRRYTPEEKRIAVESFPASGLTQGSFAKLFGTTARSLQGWLSRHQREGPKGLEPKKLGRPRGSKGRKIAEPVRSAIVECKRRFPFFGLRKIRDFLQRFSAMKVTASTVKTVLASSGIPPEAPVPRKKRLKPKIVRRWERSTPNDLWQSDITPLLLPRHRQTVYLVVFLDDCSRYVVSFALGLRQTADFVMTTLLEGISRFGKPKEVLTDQGRQYYAWRGKSAFDRLLRSHGIKHVVSRPHHPETVGKCERLWETVEREFWQRVHLEDLADARARLGHFFAHYNHFRPHQSLNGAVPADRFFGAEDQVRHAIEAELKRNELHLALEESPRKSVFLVAHVGDQQLAVHGEKGQLVFQTQEGLLQQMGLGELGVGAGKEKDDGTGGREAGRVSTDDGGGAAADPAGQEAPVHEAAAALLPGSGALGSGDGGGEGASARAVRGDPRVVDGAADSGRDRGAAEAADAAALADVAAGAGGYAGGASQTAEVSAEAGGHDDRPAERSESAPQGERGPEAPAQARGGPDPHHAPAAREPGDPRRGELGAEEGCRVPSGGEKSAEADLATPGAKQPANSSGTNTTSLNEETAVTSRPSSEEP